MRFCDVMWRPGAKFLRKFLPPPYGSLIFLDQNLKKELCRNESVHSTRQRHNAKAIYRAGFFRSIRANAGKFASANFDAWQTAVGKDETLIAMRAVGEGDVPVL